MDGITSPPMGEIKSGSFFSPLLISMIGIVATSLCIIFYHFFIVKYCKRRNQTTVATAAQSATIAYLSTGVDKKILETIPIFSFSALKRNDFPKECVVCLGELEDEDVVRVLPTCKHVFHLPCIDQWFQSHVSCPLCRSPILEQKLESSDPTALSSSVRDNINGSDRESNVPGTVNTEDTPTSSSSSAVQSYGLLRHCVSMVLPAAGARRSSHLITGLKRSLSMDQSFVAMNVQNESSIRGNNSSGGELTRSGSNATPSVNHFDRMSSKLLGSFSRLRLGRGNSATILPY